MDTTYDVLVIGAGAAGLICALEAGRRGLRVALLDHADRIGKKILISGGGRCNFTNLHTQPENFISNNPHFAKSALARYTPADFIALVEKHDIAYHEKTLGQLFCDGSARQITDMLEAECAAAGVQILLRQHVTQLRREAGDNGTGGFAVAANGLELRTRAVVIATGGLSIPKLGATAFGYDVARQFGLNVVPPRPALVPLTLSAEDCARWCDLAGVSAEVVVSIGGRHFREKMLFTHRGVSGPAMLQISSYWRPCSRIGVDLAPGREVTAGLRASSNRDPAMAKAALRQVLPARLAERWFGLHPPAAWTNQAIADWERDLHDWELLPDGTEGFEKAEVTAGGVDTAELSARTMEAKHVPGLYFIGEVVDVTGWLGGFNFQWAWASGAAAGRSLGTANSA